MNKEQLIKEINNLKKSEDVIILVHYYQSDEVQSIADYVGDSYQLSVIAKGTTAKTIIFCGVHFMAETAKILSPEKEVILPVKNAGCYMADTITYEMLKKYKKDHPHDVIISYVNTSAAVKSLSDVCVTSANALRIIKHFSEQSIMYVPDQNLARYAKDQMPNLNIKYWHGFCDIHHNLKPCDITKAKINHPEALILLHPEAPLEVLKGADYIGSTKGMLEFVKQSLKNEFVIGTERGLLYQLKQENPHKKFYLLNENLECYSMKMTSLQDVYQALIKAPNSKYEIIQIDQDILEKAQEALNKMLELS